MTEKKEIRKNVDKIKKQPIDGREKKARKLPRGIHSSEVKIIAGHNDASW